jgi:hypothetical protein
MNIREIEAGMSVHVTLRRPAFMSSDGIYRPSRKPGQSRGYDQYTRAFGRVMAHDIDAQVLTVQVTFQLDLGPNRPTANSEIPWWCIRKLLRWTGEYTTPNVGRDKTVAGTVLNRLKVAHMYEWEKDPIEQKAGVQPAMLFEEVRIQ